MTVPEKDPRKLLCSRYYALDFSDLGLNRDVVVDDLQGHRR